MKPADCILFSGGAPGAEARFGDCAERHGVEEVNFTFDGHRIDSMSDLTGQIARHEPGDRIRLGILRSGDEKQVTVTLGRAPKQAPSQVRSP